MIEDVYTSEFSGIGQKPMYSTKPRRIPGTKLQ